uniref:Chemokine interleukin-8-like domain-containing protein n=1 Tax=Salmo trutta TaxID=8032 RepID=A0A673WKI0_SALTR
MSSQSDITVTLLSCNHCLFTGVFISLLTYCSPNTFYALLVRCRCIRTSSAFISPRLFHRIEILPPGAHCRQTEIILPNTLIHHIGYTLTKKVLSRTQKGSSAVPIVEPF